MPAPIVPPPSTDSGALTTPRQLQRWLDPNRITALQRAGTYLTLPVFTAANEWNGYSDIVTSFNVEATHNFSLRNISAPSSPNYALCISYRVGDVVTRYLVWDAEGSNFNQTLTPYTGQRIKKNFRFEVWNTSQGASSQAAELTFETSVLQGFDYRWVSDAELKDNDGQVTDFDCVADGDVTAPATGMLTQFRADTGVVGADWTAMVDNVHGTAASVVTDGNVETSPDITNKQFFVNPFGTNTTFDKGSLANFADAVTAYIVFRINALEDKKEVFSIGKSSDPTIIFSLRINTDGTFGVYNYSDALVGSVSPVAYAAGDWIVAVMMWYPSVNIAVAGVSKLQSVVDAPVFNMGSNAVTVATPINFVAFNGVITSANTSVAEILLYADYNINTDVVNYLWQRYATAFNVPLVFPSTSVSTNN